MKVEWTLDSWSTPNEFLNPQWQLAIDRVYERSGGNFVINPVWGSALGVKSFDALGALSEGAFEMEISLINYWAADMPILGILGLPALYRNYWENSMAKDFLYDTYSQEFQRQWNVKLVGPVSIHQPCLVWSNKPIVKVEDFKGLTMRGFSPEMVTVLDMLGSNAITLAWSEVFTAAQRGVIDGLLTSVQGVQMLGLEQFCPYGLDLPYNFQNPVVLVNGDAWEDLPGEYKFIVLEEFTAANNRIPYRGCQVAEENWADIIANGLTRTSPSIEMYEGVEKIVAPFWDSWAQEKGGLASEALSGVRELLGK